MFASLRGKLVVKTPATIVVEVAGVGYQIQIPLSTYRQLPDTGNEVFLHLRPCYRPDNISLYGFATEEEKRLFTLLLGVSGIGPRLALTILSGTTVDAFQRAIASQDERVLSAIAGVGKKLSLRLITELKDQIGVLTETAIGRETSREAKAVEALTTLGYPRLKSLEAVRKVTTGANRDLNLEEIIKEALKVI